MSATPNAEARLDLRLDPADKTLIERAASLRGMKLSAFVRAAALRESQAVLAAEIPVLSADESRRFLEALDSPFRPNAKLARALARLAVLDP